MPWVPVPVMVVGSSVRVTRLALGTMTTDTVQPVAIVFQATFDQVGLDFGIRLFVSTIISTFGNAVSIAVFGNRLKYFFSHLLEFGIIVFRSGCAF